MSVAKNVANNTGGTGTAKTTPAASAAETVVAAKAATTVNGATKAANGDTPKTERAESNGGLDMAPLEVSPSEQAKTTAKSEAPAPARKSSFLLNMGGKQSPDRGVTDRRSVGAGGPAAADRRGSAGGGPSSRGNSPAHAPSGGSGPIGGERGRKKSSESMLVWRTCVGRTKLQLMCRPYWCSAALCFDLSCSRPVSWCLRFPLGSVFRGTLHGKKQSSFSCRTRK